MYFLNPPDGLTIINFLFSGNSGVGSIEGI